MRSDSSPPCRKPAPSLYVASALFLASLALGGLSAGCGSLASAPEETSPTISTSPNGFEESLSRVDLRVEPFSDFYFRVRAQAAGIAEPNPALAPIVDAWMPVQEEIGTFGGFWRFDLAGLLSLTPQEFGLWFNERAESIPSRAGGTIPIRGPGKAMAAAMEAVWPEVLENNWPERKARIEAVRDRLEREFMPKHRTALAYMLDSLGIEDPGVRIPLTLVVDTQPPGATTYRTRDGPVVVMSIAALLENDAFSDLEETVLHEVCHVIDLASDGDADAFTQLRQMLEEAGVEKNDRRLHDVPHLVMFVQAENTMRRIYDPDHQAYGDTTRGDIAPLYEREGEAAAVVRKHWTAYLDGESSREQALQKIVDDLTPG